VRRAVNAVAARAAAVAEQRPARLLLRSLLRAARGVGAQVRAEEILAVEELLAVRGPGTVDVPRARRVARARERRRLDRLDERADVLEVALLALDPGAAAGRALGVRIAARTRGDARRQELHERACVVGGHAAVHVDARARARVVPRRRVLVAGRGMRR